MAQTRLDRLVLLLDTGSTSLVRSAAAKQLGDVQRQHPNELYHLLERVHIHLRSKTWETRIAAGLAVRYIAEAVPLWDPPMGFETVETDEDGLNFNTFNITQVIEKGIPLVASAGKEFDVDLVDMDPKERLALQKKRLKERLGLGTQFMDVDFFEEGDVQPIAPGKVKLEDNADPFAGLSAREKNQLKRKARMAGKNKAASMYVLHDFRPRPDITSSSALKKRKTEGIDSGSQAAGDQKEGVDTSGQVVVAHKDVTHLGVFSSGDEWPFEGLCEQLCLDLFSPQWEVRHGSAIGLRELLQIQASGVGKIVGLTRVMNQIRHENWLEDLSIRLLCVLALDRFADFVGDQAVIPVRETCAMTLAVVMKFAPDKMCLQVVNDGLLKLISYNTTVTGAWEVRHAALVGLKYWMAVKTDLLDKVLVSSEPDTDAPAFLAIDTNDDIRAIASSSLIPISSRLVELLPESKIFNSVVICLWASLQELDDLTAATSFVMDLLADLVKHPSIANVMRTESQDFFQKLVPQLYPFIRHAIISVRKAVIRTLSTLADLSSDPGQNVDWISMDLLRLVFQNFILEDRREGIDSSLDLWTKLINLLHNNYSHSPAILIEKFKVGLPFLFGMIMSPIGTAIDTRLFVQCNSALKYRASETGLNISPQDRAMVDQDLTVVSDTDVIYGRIAGLAALGRLEALFINDPHLTELKLQDLTLAYTASAWAGHRLFAGIIIEECAICLPSPKMHDASPVRLFWQTIAQSLLETNAGAASLYQELQIPLQDLRNESVQLRQYFCESSQQFLPYIPSMSGAGQTEDVSNPWGPIFTITVAESLMQSVPELPGNEALSLSKGRLLTLISNYKRAQQKWDTQVQLSFASSVVSLEELPEKQNPITRSLMNAIKIEENEQLQSRAAKGIAGLIKINAKTSKGNTINEKIVKNICVYLCSDPQSVGNILTYHDGIVTLVKLKEIQEKKVTKKAESLKKKTQHIEDLDISVSSAIDMATKEEADELQKKTFNILHRGAELTLSHLCSAFGESLFELLPKLWEILSSHIIPASEQFAGSTGGSPVTQELADSLHILAVITPHIHRSLYPQLLQLLRPCIECLKCPLSLIRHLAALTLASLSKTLKVPAMVSIINHAIPLVNDGLNEYHRQGSVELIYYLVEIMEYEVLPYLVFLIVPLLGRMSDSNEDVRFVSTNVFAQLVKLSPLESGVPNPDGFPLLMIEKKETERKFIGQLIGSEKVAEFELPVPVKAELRAYQKEGVNMGLGKTLQSICIIASDHHNRKLDYEQTGALDKAHCPSLVVCPSTLTGHWFFEIKKYAEFLKPIIYAGDKGERAAIRKKIIAHDIVIISYEVLRNDLDQLMAFHFNYICLDEGHVMYKTTKISKNPNTKLTKAVKAVKGFHRVILSGTPIQNNVLELWSLFDFLMPGFLGTEQQFNERFGKPIIASRDAKSSSREQEKGALALEALHKQVLPFLMRRMKEDVLDDLPPKIIQDYYCELNEIQRMLYEDFSTSKAKDGIQDELVSGAQKKNGGQHIFQALQYLRKLCNHPSLVLTSEHPQFEKVNSLLRQQGRNLIDIENAPKLMALQQLLLDCGIGQTTQDSALMTTVPHRVLIFAQMKKMLDIIENQLFKKHMPTVTYMRLDGTTDGMKRHELVQKFNSDPSIDILLLTTHVGGLGLNLTGADTVIFVEAMDRAHRIGQKRVVNVYRLITKGTLEEKIMGLQKFKINIASSIINQDNSGIASMDTNQIMDLFALGDDTSSDHVETAGKATAKHVLSGLETLWDESQYEDMENDFFKSLKH